MIWDVAGNVWEWVKDNNTNGYGSNAFFAQMTSVTHSSTFSLSGGTTTTARNAKDQFGPLGDYSGSNVNNNAGLGYLFSGSGGGVLRGGLWSNEEISGIFSSFLSYGPATTGPGMGFRCVFR